MRFLTSILFFLLAGISTTFAVDTNDLVKLISSGCYGADTNKMLMFQGEKRAGAVIFVDECLTRGLTNAMSLTELRTWATNVIRRYNQLPEAKTVSLASNDVPKSIRNLQTAIPSCRFSYKEATNDYYCCSPAKTPPQVYFIRGDSGEIRALCISWRRYGIVVGPESYRSDKEAWYWRTFANGIFLWHD